MVKDFMSLAFDSAFLVSPVGFKIGYILGFSVNGYIFFLRTHKVILQFT